MKFSNRLKWIGFFIAALITLYFAFLAYHFDHNVTFGGEITTSDEYQIEEDADTAMFNYKRLNDTLNKRENEYRNAKLALEKYTMNFVMGSMSLGPLGIASAEKRDSKKDFPTAKSKLPQDSYYLMLNNYTTRTEKYLLEKRVYYNIHGKFYKKELKVDSAAKKQRWQTKQINYLPVITENGDKYTSIQPTAHILIPISKGVYSFLKTLWWIMVFAILVTFFHLIIGNILKVGVSISKGKAFTEANYHWLLQAGISLSSIILLGFLIQVFFYFIFLDRLDAEWRPDINWLSLIGYLSIAIFIILLAFAFRKGTRMQQEQDLTI